MKKLKLLIALSLTFAISSCSKDIEEVKPYCETNNVGTMTIINLQFDPYNVYIDGNYHFQIPSFTTKSNYELSVGSHSFYIEQASGFSVYPSAYSFTQYVAQCEESQASLN